MFVLLLVINKYKFIVFHRCHSYNRCMQKCFVLNVYHTGHFCILRLLFLILFITIHHCHSQNMIQHSSYFATGTFATGTFVCNNNAKGGTYCIALQ